MMIRQSVSTLRTGFAARLGWLSLAALGLAAASGTAAPHAIGRQGAWSSWVLGSGADRVCYTVIESSATRGAKSARLMITHRPADQVFDVVSLTAADPLALNGSAPVTVGRSSFDFFTRGSAAWSRDAATDHAVVAAMKTAPALSAVAVTATGRKLAEHYDLAGFPQALAAIDRACKIKR